MRNTVRIGFVLVMLVLLLSVITSCGGPIKHSSTPTNIVPQDPKAVTVVANQAITLDLGGGADLIIPPGAMTPGAVVHATYKGQPNGKWTNIAPLSSPVELISNPPEAIRGLLTLEFPVPANKITPGVNPAVQFGISTYNPSTKKWTPFVSTYDSARHMVVALIPHFSWWNPFSWDFTSLYASIAQDFGQLIGNRAPQATCSGAKPGWVGSLAGITNDADIAIRSCVQAQGNILDVEMVNNRPYGQILTYGSGVKWGWHEKSTAIVDTNRDNFVDANLTSNELYLPPLGKASVGIFEPAAGSNTIFHIGPTGLSVGADLLFYAFGMELDSALKFDKCTSLGLQAALGDVSVGTLRDALLGVGDCVEQTFSDMVAAGLLNSMSVSKLTAIYSGIKAAGVIAGGIVLGKDVVWKIADLVVDWIATRGSILGNGFSVYARATTQSQPSPTSGSQPPTIPTVTSQPNPSNPTVTLAQGPTKSNGEFYYAITLTGFPANSVVSIECYDSISSSGFYNFNLTVDASGSGFTQSQCFSGDGPDHWITANGIMSNHVQWGGTSSPPPPPSSTYSETTGGAANTWTNYSNAGGTEGPTIPVYQTVQIACKITGFKVADGDTWWYLIASAPWSNSYYVSADAFYNNGATSGPLKGTPFVDPNVPNC